jgi:hypothetical protein
LRADRRIRRGDTSASDDDVFRLRPLWRGGPRTVSGDVRRTPDDHRTDRTPFDRHDFRQSCLDIGDDRVWVAVPRVDAPLLEFAVRYRNGARGS